MIRFNIGFVLAVTLAIAVPLTVRAATTAPQRITYNGHLLDSSGNAITTAHTIRFSYWNSADYVSTDTTSTGAILNTATYENWQEEQSVTPNSDGYFSVELGSVTALPDFSTMSASTLLGLYLQVEVKAAADADTAYEVLDIDSADAAVDRAAVRSVPFALNANLLDQKEVGTASGSIPFLLSGGLLSKTSIPSGLARDNFIIDTDSSAVTEVTLQFGQTLAKTLKYDIDNSRFDFNDTVRIQGDLTVTGLVNGVDITSLSSDTDVHLKVTSGAGLNISVASGDYRIAGSATQFTGTSSVAISDQATTFAFFTSTGLTLSTGGFPTDKAYIPLSSIVATGGTITGITDRRIFNSDDRERLVEHVLHPNFDGVSFQGDGTSNVGQLQVAHSGAILANFYEWTSSRSALQDYDVLLRYRLPKSFIKWGDPSVQVQYHSTSSSSDDNQLDIAVYDTADALVTLSGSVTNLAGTLLTTTHMEFTGSPTWTADQDILIKFTLSAQNDNKIQLGFVKFRYTELRTE